MLVALAVVVPVPTAVMMFTPSDAWGAGTIANVAKSDAAVTAAIWFTPKSSVTVLYPYSKLNVHVRPAGMIPGTDITAPVD